MSVIIAEWSDINPGSICFSYDQIPVALQVMEFAFPLNERDKRKLSRGVSPMALVLAERLERVNYATGIIFSGHFARVTVLGPAERAGGVSRKPAFIEDVAGAICEVFGLKRGLVEVIKQHAVKRELPD